MQSQGVAAVRTAHGVLTAVLAAVVIGNPGGRKRRRADYPTYVAEFQRLDAVMRRVAPPLFLSTIAAGTGAALTAARSDPPAAALRALSAGLVAAAVRATLQVNDPVNQHMRTWQPQAPPADWQQQRARWQYGHRLRAVLIAGSAAATVTAARRKA